MAEARNPPEGGALEGERDAVVRWLRAKAADIQQRVGRADGRIYGREQHVARIASAFAADIERGDHIQPPAPAIPQSGDAAKDGQR